MRHVALAPGDLVVFSSRTIPGNEKPILDICNALIDRGIKIIGDSDRLVHVSGHPRRAELLRMYEWIRPQILVPVHGEAAHLTAQAELGAGAGIETVQQVRNGDMLRLAPGPAVIIDKVHHGRIYKDGALVGEFDELGIGERRKLSYVGHVAVSILLDSRYDFLDDPEVESHGLPTFDNEGDDMDDAIYDAVLGAVESIPRARRKDLDAVRESVRRAVRATVNESWGKKPVVTVFMNRIT
jgi:ribonuclease J